MEAVNNDETDTSSTAESADGELAHPPEQPHATSPDAVRTAATGVLLPKLAHADVCCGAGEAKLEVQEACWMSALASPRARRE